MQSRGSPREVGRGRFFFWGGFLKFDRFRVDAVKKRSLSICKTQYSVFAGAVNYSTKLTFFENRLDESDVFGKPCRRERCF